MERDGKGGKERERERERGKEGRREEVREISRREHTSVRAVDDSGSRG